MSFDLPTASLSTNTIEVTPTSFGEALDPSSTVYQQPLLTGASATKRRRSSKGTMPSVVKRSASTPNVRGLAAADAAALSLSAADKRRNKLGYHRTSVACDQQPQPERRPRTGSRAEATSGEGSGSSSSSPALPPGQGVPLVGSFSTYSPLRSDLPPNYKSPHGTTRASNSTSMKAPPLPQPYGYTHEVGNPQMWDRSSFNERPSGARVSRLQETEDPSSNYWKLAESPMTPGFPPFTGHVTHSPQHPPSSSSAFLNREGQREVNGWPLPPRAMSFGQIEDLPVDYANRYAFHRDYKHNVGDDMYPPSLETGIMSMGSTSESTPASTSLPSRSQPSHSFGVSPVWGAFSGHQMSGMIGKSSEAIAGWYSGEAAPLAQVQEEDTGPQYGGSSSMFYQGGGHKPG
ncbi:MAG: hypothetical protein M1827_001197 [Pycnora praestabilis]|nr:MAG: hypothetical protein M1827_001197 [Pycnora praestabilis]